MMECIQGAKHALRGELRVPGDKSISHRTVMLGALSSGITRAGGFLNGADCLSTISCFRKMGAEIELSAGDTELRIRGCGLRGLSAPDGPLDCGNSGTSIRLLSGILSAQRFSSRLTGDESIQRRPMGRVIRPLTEMGAEIVSERGNGCAPLEICGRELRGIRYESPVASAQVKSAILFAGLYAGGETCVVEPSLSRDHSERMLQALGAELRSSVLPDGRAEIRISPCGELHALPERIEIPGDISSAAYFIAAALLVPGSELLIRNVGVNPTRSGVLEVFRSMGADIRLENQAMAGLEEVADIYVKYAPLHATEIGGALIPRLIDELPVIAAVMARAEGKSIIRDAAELKVKESNRLSAMTEGLRRCGVRAEETEDGMCITGEGEALCLQDAVIDSYRDHRISMSFAVLGLAGGQKTTLKIMDADCIQISYPDFFKDFKKVVDRN